MKNLFRKKPKHQPPQAQVPRSKEEIDKAVADIVTKIGLTEYEIFVRQENLKAYNHQAVLIGKEQEARKALDQLAAEEAAKKEKETNVQS